MQDADTRNGREIDAENAAGFFTQGDGSGRRRSVADTRDTWQRIVAA